MDNLEHLAHPYRSFIDMIENRTFDQLAVGDSAQIVRTFTQDDIDGKMPALLHDMLDEYQVMLQPIQQQFLQIARETAQELERPDPTPANNTG